MKGFHHKSLSSFFITMGVCFLLILPVDPTPPFVQIVSVDVGPVFCLHVSGLASGVLAPRKAAASPTNLELQNNEFDRLVEEMRNHMRHGQVEEAIRSARAALEIDASHPQTLADLKCLQDMKAIVEQRLTNIPGLETPIPPDNPAQHEKAYIEILEVGEIDWTNGMLRAKGIGGFPHGFPDKKGAAVLAQKAAVEMAMYKLLTLIYQVRIDHSTLVGEMVSRDKRYKESVQAMLGKAQIIGQECRSDGAVEVTMRMPFYFLADPANKLASQQTDFLGNFEYSVFLGGEHFIGSPLEEYGHKHLFQVHAFGNSEIEVLQNGCDSLAARIATIRNAKKSIRIQSLIFSGDESGRYIAEILKQKRQQGVNVRIIIDGLSNPAWRDQMMYYDLQRADIPVEGYEALFLQWVRMLPPLKKMIQNALDGKNILDIDPDKAEIPYDPLNANKRYHEKMWIVDGETDHGVAIIGGRNIANEYFRVNDKDPKKLWRDQDVIVKGSIVKDMVTAFDRTYTGLWNDKENQLIDFNKTWEEWNKLCNMTNSCNSLLPNVNSELMSNVVAIANRKLDLDFKPVKARFFQNQTRLGETYITQAYLKLLNESREILIANAYFIPSKNLIASIKGAVRRGANVKIVTNSLDTNDVPEMTILSRHYYKEILSVNDEPEVISRNALKAENESRAEVEIWEWQGELKNGMGTIHAKYAVFDKLVCLVGSHNLDPRSEFFNSETAIVLENKTLGEELASIFYETDLTCSKKITMAEADDFYSPKDIGNKMRKAFGKLFEDML